MRAHVSFEPDPEHLAALEQAAPGVTFGKPIPDGLDVLVRGVPSEADLAGLREGGALVIPYSGLPTATRERLAARPDLQVYNLHHNAPLVAEHAVGLLLAAARQLVPMHEALRQGDWRPRWAPDDSPGLAGHRAAVVGFGAIGRRIGAALTALGMDVVGLRRDDGPDRLDAELATARAVILALPLTPDTEGLLDADRIARMSPSTVLVNIARGAVCDEATLYAALRDRRLFAAGLDVWWRYPEPDAREATPASELPFHELPNVVLSPHRAGHGAATEELRTRALAEVLRTLAAGETPGSRVRVDLGY